MGRARWKKALSHDVRLALYPKRNEKPMHLKQANELIGLCLETLLWPRVENGGERSKFGEEGCIRKLLEAYRQQMVMCLEPGEG